MRSRRNEPHGMPTKPGALHRGRAAAMIRRLALTVAVAVTACGLSVPAASAGEFESISTKRGTVAFNDDTGYLFALDSRRDGLGILATLTWKNDGGETLRDAGAGGVAESEYVNLLEGTKLKLRMCYFNDTEIVKCSKPQKAVA
jgi:hypothetical protein